MKLCCDENIRRGITTVLEQEGHDVIRVQDVLELGSEDQEILEFCRETDRILVTNDEDFFDFDTHPGVLFLDEQRASPRDVATAVRRIERQVTDVADQVWHIPDGWV